MASEGLETRTRVTTINRKFQYFQYKSNYTQENFNVENIECQPLNQLVCNRANSSGTGPAHLKNKKKKD